jgi:hypothetical protein
MHVIFVCESFSCQMELIVRDYLFYSVQLSPSKLKLGKCQAIVGDGLSIGRPCCGVFRCKEPLPNNRHRFCLGHENLHGVCAINGCENPVVELVSQDPKGGPPKITKKKTCSLPVHQQIETKHQQRSTGSFLYKQRLVCEGRHARHAACTSSFFLNAIHID